MEILPPLDGHKKRRDKNPIDIDRLRVRSDSASPPNARQMSAKCPPSTSAIEVSTLSGVISLHGQVWIMAGLRSTSLTNVHKVYNPDLQSRSTIKLYVHHQHPRSTCTINIPDQRRIAREIDIQTTKSNNRHDSRNFRKPKTELQTASQKQKALRNVQQRLNVRAAWPPSAIRKTKEQNYLRTGNNDRSGRSNQRPAIFFPVCSVERKSERKSERESSGRETLHSEASFAERR